MYYIVYKIIVQFYESYDFAIPNVKKKKKCKLRKTYGVRDLTWEWKFKRRKRGESEGAMFEGHVTLESYVMSNAREGRDYLPTLIHSMDVVV